MPLECRAIQRLYVTMPSRSRQHRHGQSRFGRAHPASGAGAIEERAIARVGGAGAILTEILAAAHPSDLDVEKSDVEANRGVSPTIGLRNLWKYCGTSFRVLVRAYNLLAITLVITYIVLWDSIDFAQYASYNLHIWDSGVAFSLAYGNAPSTLGYGHLAFGWTNLIFLLFVPIVKLFPNPLTLVVAQNILFGLSGFFLYLIAARILKSATKAVLIEGLYLFNYSLFGAAFYPFHWETMFSVFFAMAFYFWISKHPIALAVCLSLSALASPLGALTVVVFVAIEVLPLFSSSRRISRGTIGIFRDHWPELVGTSVAVLSVLVAILAVGFWEVVSYSHVSGLSAAGVAGGTTTGIQGKFVYFVLVLVPFGLGIFRSKFVLLILPYFLLVLLSSLNHYTEFWYSYTFLIGTLLFIAYVDSIATGSGERPPAPPRQSHRGGHAWRLSPQNRSLLQTTGFVVALGLLILPYSPLNSFAGDYNPSVPFYNLNLPTLTDVSAYDVALGQLASQVPLDSSVLIQENMVSLVNRHVWYEPGSYDNQSIEYVLTDPSSWTFTLVPPAFIGPYSTSMLQWFNGLYGSGRFGVMSEYQGAILLRAGYSGLPSRFVPYVVNLTGSAFGGSPPVLPVHDGAVISVTNLTNGFGAFHSTNGLLTLPPGTYSAAFQMMTTNDSPTNTITLGVSEVNYTDPIRHIVVSSMQVNGTRFSNDATWHSLEFTFTLSKYVADAYLEVYDTYWHGTLSLRGATLFQGSP